MADDDGDRFDDYTPITDFSDAFEAIGQNKEMTRQLLYGVFPEMREDIKKANTSAQGAREAANEALIESQLVRSDLENIDRRVVSVETEVKETRTLRENGILTKAKLDGVAQAVEEKRGFRTSMWGAIVSVALFALATLGGAIWYVAGMDRDLAHEREVREKALETIGEKLKELPRASDIPSVEAIEEQASKRAATRGPTVKEWYKSLTARQKRQLKRSKIPL